MMQDENIQHNGHIHELSTEEAVRLFDARARFHLDIGGEEFLRRWREGEFAGKSDHPGIASLVMLLPLVDEESRTAGK